MHNIVKETCAAIWDSLVEKEMSPSTQERWEEIEKEFNSCWNFPNCIGAVNGKHIVITAPFNSGSLFHNYKGTFSINLLALVDANYKFIFIDIGQYRSNADGGVFQRSEFGKRFLNRDLQVPPPKLIEDTPHIGLMPHCIVTDEVFPLRIDLMRPNPRRSKNENLPEDKAIFNYRLSRARHIVENTFGILAQRWRLLNRHIQLQEQNVVQVIKACCVLHNFLWDTPAYTDRSTLQVDTQGSVLIPDGGQILNVAYLMGYHSAKDALQTQELFKDYFVSPQGALPWQLECIREE